MKRILITGENSYIGTSFESYMSKFSGNYQIDTVSTFNDEWKKADFSKYDVVFHVAGIAHLKNIPNDMYFKINHELAVNVAHHAKMNGIKQFILLSSMSVYSPKDKVIFADTEANPQSAYGKSKLLADIEISKLQDASFSVSILRPPMVYGKGCKGNFPKLVNLAKVCPLFPDIENKRSMIYIENLCEFVKLSIDDETCGYFHPQNQDYVCTTDLVKKIVTTQGKGIFTTKLFNFIIVPLSRHIGILDKVFGDLVYDKSMSNHQINFYCVVSFAESIKESLF